MGGAPVKSQMTTQGTGRGGQWSSVPREPARKTGSVIKARREVGIMHNYINYMGFLLVTSFC